MRWRGTKAELLNSLRLVPRVLAGVHPDALGIAPVFWGTIANAALKEIRGAYLTKLEGFEGSDGVTWAKLAVATLAKRQREGRDDADILLETGRLLASLRPGADHFPLGNPDQVFDIHPGGVTVGTAHEHADKHQRGTTHMPARPIVPVDGNLPRAWEKPVEDAMRDAMLKVIAMVVDAGGIK